MLLITGATGNIGSRVVDLLKGQGHDVRALVRDASRADLLPDGIDIAVGNLDDADSVAAALHGVDGVFLLHAGQGTAQTQIMIDAARSAGVRRIVLLSSLGARLRPLPTIGATFAAREDLLRESGLDVTYLRPNGLMSNALWWTDAIRDENRVVDPTGPGRQAVVDPDDIARRCARTHRGRPRRPRLHPQRAGGAHRPRAGRDPFGRPRTHHRLRRRHARATRAGEHRAWYPASGGRSPAEPQRDVPCWPSRGDHRRHREPHRRRAADLPRLVRAPRRHVPLRRGPRIHVLSCVCAIIRRLRGRLACCRPDRLKRARPVHRYPGGERPGAVEPGHGRRGDAAAPLRATRHRRGHAPGDGTI